MRDKVIQEFTQLDLQQLSTVTDLSALKTLAEQCQVCEHACRATQVVIDEHDAKKPTIMLVLPQPDDLSDRQGEPQANPVLAELLAWLEQQAAVYIHVSYAVKHFYYQVKQRQRVAMPVTKTQQQNCLPWLEQEFKLVQPVKIICLQCQWLSQTHKDSVLEVNYSPEQLLKHSLARRQILNFITN